MVQFLDELQGTATPALTMEEMVELEQLRAKYEQLKKAKAGETAAATSKPAKKAKDSDESSSDSEVSAKFIVEKSDFCSLKMVKIFARSTQSLL